MGDEREHREHIGAGFSVEVYDQARLATEMQALLPQLTEVTTNALGKTPKDMQEVASEWQEIIAVREGGRIVGYGGYVIEDIPGVGKVLHESGKMVAKTTQGKQYGSRITERALSLHPDAEYFTFTSQNPREIQSVRRALNGRQLAPIDISYQDDPDLQRALERIIAHTHRRGINPQTGLRHGLYFGERFGDYTVDLGNPNIAFIESRLQAIGFDRDAGDGVFFMAKLKDSENKSGGLRRFASFLRRRLL